MKVLQEITPTIVILMHKAKYSERTPFSYYGMEIDHCNHCSIPSPLSSQEPNKQKDKRYSMYEYS